MTKSIRTYFLSAVSLLLINLSNAQSPLPVLTAESGRQSADMTLCWSFRDIRYTTATAHTITGNWSLRSLTPSNIDPDACWVKSPWIMVNGNQISLKLKFEASGAATIRRVIASYISYDQNVPSFESPITRFDSLDYYTTSFGNNLPTSMQNVTFTIPSSIVNNNKLYKIMISFVGTGGTTRYNIDDIAIPGIYSSNPSNNCSPIAAIQDADNDGVADADDAYPNDSERAYNNFYPSANGFGTLLYEDLWPGMGDYDFNDLVLSYRINKVTNAQNKVTELKLTYVVKAAGSSYQNGFAIQLDGITPAMIRSVSGTKTSNAPWLVRNSNGVESGQDFANIIVYDNVNKFMINPGTIGINTKPGSTRVAPDTTNLTIRFATESYSIAAGDLIINPYLISNQIRGKEIHLPGFKPTTKADPSFFGLNQDNTNPQTNNFYKSKSNLPWALSVPEAIPHLKEGSDFLKGYTNFWKWALSNGLNNSDWFLNHTGNRDINSLYSEQ
jgi:LruC domain-containing protein